MYCVRFACSVYPSYDANMVAWCPQEGDDEEKTKAPKGESGPLQEVFAGNKNLRSDDVRQRDTSR